MAFGSNPPPIQVHLCVKGGDAAIAFYEKSFGGSCTFKQMAQDGKRDPEITMLHVPPIVMADVTA